MVPNHSFEPFGSLSVTMVGAYGKTTLVVNGAKFYLLNQLNGDAAYPPPPWNQIIVFVWVFPVLGERMIQPSFVNETSWVVLAQPLYSEHYDGADADWAIPIKLKVLTIFLSIFLDDYYFLLLD